PGHASRPDHDPHREESHRGRQTPAQRCRVDDSQPRFDRGCRPGRAPAPPGADTCRSFMSEQSLVLVVEDNEANQLLARSVLEREGYRVEIAGNAQEALEKLSITPPDLILMDV